MTELVYYELCGSADKLTSGDFDCHLCLAQFGSFDDIQKHYLTGHTNVIIAIKDGSGKCKIRRRFVGPRSRRPKFWQSLVGQDEADEVHVEVANFFKQRKELWPPIQNTSVSVDNSQPVKDICLDLDEETEPWPSLTELLVEGYNDVAATLDLEDLTSSVDDLMSDLNCFGASLKDTSTDEELLLQTISPLRIHDASEKVQNPVIVGIENETTMHTDMDTETQLSSNVDVEVVAAHLPFPGGEKHSVDFQPAIISAGDSTDADPDQMLLVPAGTTLEADDIAEIEWCDVLSFLSDVGAQCTDEPLEFGVPAVSVPQELDEIIGKRKSDPPFTEDVNFADIIEADPPEDGDLQNIISEMISEITTAEMQYSTNNIGEDKENVEDTVINTSSTPVSSHLNSPAPASGGGDQVIRKRKWGSCSNNINGVCENGGGRSQKKLCCWMTSTMTPSRNDAKVKRTKSPPLSTSPQLIRRKSLRYLTKSKQM